MGGKSLARGADAPLPGCNGCTTASQRSRRMAGRSGGDYRLMDMRPVIVAVMAMIVMVVPMRRLVLGQHLGDLHRVERGALPEIVRHHPQRQAMRHGRVAADAADIDRV